MRLMSDGRIEREFFVSTSKFGLGTEEGSFKTPLGHFRIAQKIGAEAEKGTVFKGRVPVGVWAPGEPAEEDMILSRIMWLAGCDTDNGNTHARYIYIHGTNDEDLIGSVASYGCVRMKNADVIELFDLVEEGVAVTIEDYPLRGH